MQQKRHFMGPFVCFCNCSTSNVNYAGGGEVKNVGSSQCCQLLPMSLLSLRCFSGSVVCIPNRFGIAHRTKRPQKSVLSGRLCLLKPQKMVLDERREIFKLWFLSAMHRVHTVQSKEPTLILYAIDTACTGLTDKTSYIIT